MKAVILAGGTGTRLWPLSRKSTPKQLQALISDKTLLEETIDRLDFLNPKDIFIATNEEYTEKVKALAPQIPEQNIIAEPACRDTAPCIGFAAAYIGAITDPEEIMCIVYADHLVQNPEEFANTLKAAEQQAKEENTLNIIEVKAKTPNTNLGYVKIREKIKEINGHPIHKFEKFIEKPNLEKAKELLKDESYLWNTGFYVWKISKILKEFKKHAPQIYEELMIIKKAIGTEKEQEVIKNHYKKCNKISIDYAIMEKTNPENVRIIPADIQWSDIGTWSAIHEELAKSPEDNITKGEHIGIETTGSLIYGTTNKPIMTIGLKNMIVVETNDAILVCTKNKSQNVKKMVEKLKKENREELL